MEPLLTRWYDQIEQLLKPGQVLVIYGPRQVGKTTLVRNFMKQTSYRTKFDAGDTLTAQKVLSSGNLQTIGNYLESYDVLVLDEAHYIPHIGAGLKLITDHFPHMRVIATGSSSFDLSGQIGEPLTGRKHTITLYPIAQLELRTTYNTFELQQKLPELLIFGSYPQVITGKTQQEKIDAVTEIVESYLLKDILSLEHIKGSKVLHDILKFIAFQVSSEVSLTEIAQQVHIDIKTVQRYLDLLEKSFILFSLRGFSRNLRNEITGKAKYYFFDTGIRNGIISQFNQLESRNDVGALWENFVMIERMKKRAYQSIYSNTYFWRTYGGKEIDLIEERDGQLHGYECKWSQNKRVKPPTEFITTYRDSTFSIITPETYLPFVA